MTTRSEYGRGAGVVKWQSKMHTASLSGALGHVEGGFGGFQLGRYAATLPAAGTPAQAGSPRTRGAISAPVGAEVGAPAGRRSEPQRGGGRSPSGAGRSPPGRDGPQAGCGSWSLGRSRRLAAPGRGRTRPRPVGTITALMLRAEVPRGDPAAESLPPERGTPSAGGRDSAAGRNIRRGLSDPSGGACGCAPGSGFRGPPASRPSRRRAGRPPTAQTGDEGRGGRACEADPQGTPDRVQPASGRGPAGELE